MAEVGKEHAGALPFSLRNLVPALGEPGARLGVVEPVKHGILRPFPVLFERDGVLVAHFQFTVLMLSGGTLKVSGLDLPAFVKSEKTRTFFLSLSSVVWFRARTISIIQLAAVPEDIAALLAQEAHTSKKAKKKAAALGPAQDAASASAGASTADTEMSIA